MLYREEAKKLFDTYAPDSGQADTVQGELIRCVYHLRMEAYRNGNMNWDRGFVLMADYLQNTLCVGDEFNKAEKKQIKADLKRIKKFNDVLDDDTLYDRITDKVVEWSRLHTEPINRPPNPDLKR